MKNYLLMDIGNSSVDIATYSEKVVNSIMRRGHAELLESLKNNKWGAVEEIVVASVVPKLDQELESLTSIPIHFVTEQTIPTLSIHLDQPEQVGADRIVGSLGAHHKYQKNTLIVDSGTAITFCYITKDGVYEGGAIFPGMGIASQALNLYTEKIPHIQVSPQTNIVGKSTKEAVEGGLYQGYIHMINGMITAYQKEIDDLFVIGTGAGLDVIKDQLRIDKYEPHLVIDGLAICADNLE